MEIRLGYQKRGLCSAMSLVAPQTWYCALSADRELSSCSSSCSYHQVSTEGQETWPVAQPNQSVEVYSSQQQATCGSL